MPIKWIVTGTNEERSGSVHICSPLAFNLMSGLEQRCVGTHPAPCVSLCDSQGFSILFLCLPLRTPTISLEHCMVSMQKHKASWLDQSEFLSFSVLPTSHLATICLPLAFCILRIGVPHTDSMVPIPLSEH